MAFDETYLTDLDIDFYATSTPINNHELVVALPEPAGGVGVFINN